MRHALSLEPDNGIYCICWPMLVLPVTIRVSHETIFFQSILGKQENLHLIPCVSSSALPLQGLTHALTL